MPCREMDWFDDCELCRFISAGRCAGAGLVAPEAGACGDRLAEGIVYGYVCQLAAVVELHEQMQSGDDRMLLSWLSRASQLVSRSVHSAWQR